MKEAPLAAPFDEDGLCRLTERVAAKHAGRVRAVVESMNGARFVHDTLEAQGWDVLVADARTSASAEGRLTPAYAPQCGSLRGGSRQCSCSSRAGVCRRALRALALGSKQSSGTPLPARISQTFSEITSLGDTVNPASLSAETAPVSTTRRSSAASQLS